MSAVSARKIRANRSNARKSTGPISSAGRARVARNALKHGVYCAELLLPGESKSMLALHREQFIRSLVPMDAMELLLVERIVTAQWKLRRMNLLERGLHETQLDRLRIETERQIAMLDEEIEYRKDKSEQMRREGYNAKSILEFFAERTQDARRDVNQATDELKELARDLENRAAAEPQPQERLDRYRRVLRDILALNAEPSWVQTVQANLGSKLEGLESMERLSRLEQRLENSIHRNMRELLRLREHRAKHPRPEGETNEMLCPSPYVTSDSALMEDAADEAFEKLRNKATEEETDRKCNPDEDLPAKPEATKPENERTKPDRCVEPVYPTKKSEPSSSPSAPGTD